MDYTGLAEASPPLQASDSGRPANDGRLDAAERASIKRKQDKLSHRIDSQKPDDQSR